MEQEELGESTANNHKFRQLTCSDYCGSEVSDGDPGTWLNLTLGSRTSSAAKISPGCQSKPATCKMYACNFCVRKFFGSQALGGIKMPTVRERSAARMFVRPGREINVKSSRVHPQSFFQFTSQRNKEGMGGVARFDETTSHIKMTQTPSAPEEAAGMMWPGSFQMGSQLSKQTSKVDKG